jgi:hypothetical protein
MAAQQQMRQTLLAAVLMLRISGNVMSLLNNPFEINNLFLSFGSG